MSVHSSSLPRCRFKLPSTVSSRFFKVVKSSGPSTCNAVMMPSRMGPCTAVSRPLKSMGFILAFDLPDLPDLDDGKRQCQSDKHHPKQHAIHFMMTLRERQTKAVGQKRDGIAQQNPCF